MKKYTLAFGTLFLLLFMFIGWGTFAQEKAPRWFDVGDKSSTRIQRIAIENISAHMHELTRLEAQGLSASEIDARLDAQSAQSRLRSLSSTTGFAETGSISGSLYEKGGGPTQSYVSVYAYDIYGNSAGYDSSYGSDSGQYQINGLAPGRYYLRTRSSYYDDVYYRNTSNWRRAKLVGVTKNKGKKGIDFVLGRTGGKGSIAGRVQRPSGASMRDVQVYAYKSDYNFYRSGTTMASGIYFIPNLPAGEYIVQCSYKVNDTYVSIWYPGSQTDDDAVLVTVKEPDTTLGIDFVIPFGGTISGKVVNSAGTPLNAYDADVHAFDKGNIFVRSGRTDENGRFKISELWSGPYRLFVDYRGRENNISGWHYRASDFSKAKALAVRSKKITNVSIKLAPGAIISGQIINYDGLAPPEGCYAEIYDQRGSLVEKTQVAQDGSYSLSGLSSGTYKVHIDTTYCRFYSTRAPCSEWYGGAYSFSEAASITVNAQQKVGNIDVPLHQGGYITGTLRGPGTHTSGYQGEVNAYDLNGNFIRDSDADFNGRYVLIGLPSGKYKLLGSYSSWGQDSYAEFYENKQNFGAATTVSVSAPGGTSGINFMLEAPASVSAFITDSKNSRLSSQDQSIRVFAYSADSGEYAISDFNSFSGGFRIGLLEGSYRFGAVQYNIDKTPKPWDLAVTYYPRGAEFYAPENHTIWTSPGETKKLNPIVMSKAPGSVSGTVFDKSSGLSLDSSAFYVFAFDQNGFVAGVSAYGFYAEAPISTYKVGGLRAGVYYLIAYVMPICEAGCEPYGEWYGGLALTQEEMTFLSPKMTIPSGVYPITVGQEDTGTIDFFVKK